MFGGVSKLKLIVKANLSKLFMLGLNVRAGLVANDELDVLKAKGQKISEITSQSFCLVLLLISQASFPFAILTLSSFFSCQASYQKSFFNREYWNF
jgi:hypothetical protein